MRPNSRTAIIVAGGKGQRMEGPVKKQYIELCGLPVLARTIDTFCKCTSIDAIVVVVPENDLHYVKTVVVPLITLPTPPINCIAGGKERQDSVFNGLTSLNNPNPDDIVIIHDGVRPFVSQEQIVTSIATADRYGASIVAVPVTDTLKKTAGDIITGTLDRQALFAAQTPQTFKYEVIMQAHTQARKKRITATDDSALVEHFGHRVHVTLGARTNIKLTTPDDILLGTAILNTTR